MECWMPWRKRWKLEIPTPCMGNNILLQSILKSFNLVKITIHCITFLFKVKGIKGQFHIVNLLQSIPI